jgi:peptidoglycan hydrolase-like protein with peptidoglycan-binding domain
MQMTAGPVTAGRSEVVPGGRRSARFAVVLVLVGGLALTSGCAGLVPPSPADLPPAAAAAPTTDGAAPSTGPEASGTAAPPTSAPPTSPAPDPATQKLRLEDEGPAVLEVQQRLADLGYWLGEVDGHFGQLTRQAVMAFQKAEGLTRDGIAGPQTRQALPAASRPQPKVPEGDHLEVDLDRQLLLVVRSGQVQWAFNTSTGNGEAYDRPSGGSGVARTPRGDFEVERQINGYRNAPLGTLYRPKYFRGGIAVHGSGSIPAQPASHGCVRVTNAAMDLLWASDVAPIGTPVTVY